MSLTLLHAAERARLRVAEADDAAAARAAVEKALVAIDGPLHAVVDSFGLDAVEAKELLAELNPELLARSLAETIFAAVTTAGRKTGLGHRFY